MRLIAALATLGMLAATTGCTLLDRDQASGLIDRSQAIYATIPAYPGARQLAVTTSTGHSTESGAADIGDAVGTFALPKTATIRKVEQFYRARLTARGWALREHLPRTANHSAGPVDNYTRGRSMISVNLEGGYGRRLEIGVGTRGG